MHDNIVNTPLLGYHIPVMLQECIDGLAIRPEGVYADVTFGGGGHSRTILSQLGEGGRLYAFDQDADAEKNAVEGDERFTFVRSNFRYIANWMRYYGVDYLDGLLADLGVSSHHFDDASRGFSFRHDARLDMRMNGRSGLTAADILQQYDEVALARIFRLYGECRNAASMASVIVRERSENPVETVEKFIQILKPFLPTTREKKELAKIFQALRIEVNHELDALQEMLDAAVRLLRPGGRLVVLTYHSLEDRLVKNYMRAGNAEGLLDVDFYGNRKAPLRPLGGKPKQPSTEEQTRNPRSRSAKLRIATKV